MVCHCNRLANDSSIPSEKVRLPNGFRLRGRRLTMPTWTIGRESPTDSRITIPPDGRGKVLEMASLVSPGG